VSWLIDLLTYQSGHQRGAQAFGALMLAVSAITIFWCMVRLERKPMLDKALTVKQFWLILLGIRGAVAVLFDRPSELWGTAVWVALGIASIGVMVETIKERRNPRDAWEDPYAVIDERDREIAALKASNAEMSRRLGMAVVLDG
jgi:hypothetical protein